MAASDPSVPDTPLPPGLPDPASLARLASEFFAALPGSAPPAGMPFASAPVALGPAANLPATPPSSPQFSNPAELLPYGAPALSVASNPAPPGSPLAGPGGTGTGIPGASLPQGKVPGANLLPASPTHILSLGNRAPSLLPHAEAQNRLPDNVTTVAPAFDSRFGGMALGVPQVYDGDAGARAPYAAADPARGLQASPLSTGLPSSLDAFGAPAAAVAPGSIGLPGAPSASQMPPAPPSAGAPGLPSFYFLTDAAPDSSWGNTPGKSGAPATSAPVTGATPGAAGGGRAPFDVHTIRRDFPILSERVNGRQLVWFDNAATTQKPQAVIDRLAYFYQHENSNIHRAAHALAGRATDAYEYARRTVQRFINAGSPDEIIFTRGTTESVNLIAKSWGVKNVAAGDEIIISNLEHHANIVPWQQLASQVGATLRVIPVDDNGQVLLGEYQKLLNARTRIVSVTQVSNALGTVVPVKEIIEMAHRAGAKAMVDGAQSISHMSIDVQALDADFFVFSGHKIFGPTGIGAVYGKRAILEDMPPWEGGGNMIADVTFERTIFQPPPGRFEAGTGNIADAVGLSAALDYVSRIGIENVARYEHELLEYATERLAPIPGVRIIGTAAHKASVLSFVLRGYETEEVGRALNEEGIAVRSGHHCAQPILRRMGVEQTVRPSLAFYNTTDEVDAFIAVVRRLSSARR